MRYLTENGYFSMLTVIRLEKKQEKVSEICTKLSKIFTANYCRQLINLDTYYISIRNLLDSTDDKTNVTQICLQYIQLGKFTSDVRNNLSFSVRLEGSSGKPEDYTRVPETELAEIAKRSALLLSTNITR
jgi:hypothetical protein